MNTYQDEGTSRGFGIFFSNGDFSSPLCCNLFRTVLFLEKLVLKLFQSNYFDTTVTFSEQLFLQSSFFFFEELLFQSSHFFRSSYFFRTAAFSERNFYRQPLFEKKKLATFRNSYHFAEELFRIKISTEELLFRSRYFSTGSTFSEKLHLEKDNFSEKYYSALPTFSGELPF